MIYTTHENFHFKIKLMGRFLGVVKLIKKPITINYVISVIKKVQNFYLET